MKQTQQLSFILAPTMAWQSGRQVTSSRPKLRTIQRHSNDIKALFLYHFWRMQFKKLATCMFSAFASKTHRKSLWNFHRRGWAAFLYDKTGFLYKMGRLVKMRECVFYKIHGLHADKNISHYKMDAPSVRKSCLKEAGCIHFVENSPLQNERPSVW